MSDIIQFNRFSELHDGENIFFCKTDFLQRDFDTIKKKNKKVILISGNSDIPITNETVEHAPTNIFAWFCQNNLSNNPKVVSLPLGIENSFECKRLGHGVAWDFALEKNKILSSIFEKTISGETLNLIYSNFNIHTNPLWRNQVKAACLNQEHITFKESNLSYEEFISDILSHKASICPSGNGIDTHRLYETLYANRIPIVFSRDQKHIYDTLYKSLPVICLNNVLQISNKNLINNLINKLNNNTEKIKYSYWKKRIQSLINHI